MQRRRLFALLDRFTGFLPAGPTRKTGIDPNADPRAPGLRKETRRARWRVWRHRYAKPGKGGYN